METKFAADARGPNGFLKARSSYPGCFRPASVQNDIGSAAGFATASSIIGALSIFQVLFGGGLGGQGGTCKPSAPFGPASPKDVLVNENCSHDRQHQDEKGTDRFR
jgi:hypothetical protein